MILISFTLYSAISPFYLLVVYQSHTSSAALHSTGIVIPVSGSS